MPRLSFTQIGFIVITFIQLCPKVSFSNGYNYLVRNGQRGDVNGLPFVVSIEITYNNGTSTNGSGVAIGPNWVLTAAHAVHDVNVDLTYIVAGLNDTNELPDLNPEDQIEHVFTIGQIEIHPYYQYDQRNTNDIALIEVQGEGGGNLPGWIEYNDDPNLVTIGDEINFAGFGLDDTDEPGILNRGSNFVDNLNDYVFVYDNLDNNPPHHLLPTTEQGDSGAPIWIMRGGRPLLVAIHIRGGDDNLINGIGTHRYIVDLNVANYRNWIAANTEIGANGAEVIDEITDPLEDGPPRNLPPFPDIEELPPLEIVIPPAEPAPIIPSIIKAITPLTLIIPLVSIRQPSLSEPPSPQPPLGNHPERSQNPYIREEDEQKVPDAEDLDGQTARAQEERQGLLRQRGKQAKNIRTNNNIDDCESKGPF